LPHVARVEMGIGVCSDSPIEMNEVRFLSSFILAVTIIDAVDTISIGNGTVNRVAQLEQIRDLLRNINDNFS
jgi:hypothetical protein